MLDTISCRLDSYTSLNTTCRCSMSIGNRRHRRRLLDHSDDIVVDLPVYTYTTEVLVDGSQSFILTVPSPVPSAAPSPLPTFATTIVAVFGFEGLTREQVDASAILQFSLRSALAYSLEIDVDAVNEEVVVTVGSDEQRRNRKRNLSSLEISIELAVLVCTLYYSVTSSHHLLTGHFMMTILDQCAECDGVASNRNLQ